MSLEQWKEEMLVICTTQKALQMCRKICFYSKHNSLYLQNAAKLWNTLPNDIRDCNTKARFGASLKWFLPADSWGM
jgi:hypothetical protein